MNLTDLDFHAYERFPYISPFFPSQSIGDGVLNSLKQLQGRSGILYTGQMDLDVTPNFHFLIPP
jgi:hypothetical protein